MPQTYEEILATPLGPNQGMMAVITRYDADKENPNQTPGDTKIMWDRTSTDEVANAREQFAFWKRKGWMAYKVDKTGTKTSEVIKEFDPTAQTIIFSPPMQGG